jgi:hypothetical protein
MAEHRANPPQHLIDQQLGDLFVGELEDLFADVLGVLARRLVGNGADRGLLASITGASSPLSLPQRLQIACAVNESHNVSFVPSHPIDEAVAPNEKFSDAGVRELGDDPPPLCQMG